MSNEFSFVVLFTLGLFSTFHCIGMCGGVIGALTFGLDQQIRENKFKLTIYVAAYNLGRLTSYAIAGLIIGFVGSSLVGTIGMDSAHKVTRDPVCGDDGCCWFLCGGLVSTAFKTG